MLTVEQLLMIIGLLCVVCFFLGLRVGRAS